MKNLDHKKQKLPESTTEATQNRYKKQKYDGSNIHQK